MANNPSLYNAALSGLAGGVQASRWPVSPDPADYTPVRNELLPIAAAIDAAIPAQGLTAGGNQLMAAIALAVMATRYPTQSGDPAALAAAVAAYWTLLNESLDPAGGGDCCVSVMAYTGGSFDDVAGINAALASAAAGICFPAGIYQINDYVVSELASKQLIFEPGVIFEIDATGLEEDIITINGDDSCIVGRPTFRISRNTIEEIVILHLAGENCTTEDDLFFQLDDDATNTTLIKMSGDHCQIADVITRGVGEFGRGIDLTHDDGTEVHWLETGRFFFNPTDDGVTTRNFGTLVRMNCADSVQGGIVCNTGGRTILDMGWDVVGHKNQIRNPQFNATQANWALRIRDGAEFLELWGGILHQSSDGSARVGSQGIECAEGSFKGFGTKVIGFDFGIRFTNACDTCVLTGMPIANNKTANLQIDTTGAVPVNGLTLTGCYFECEAVDTCINLHFKTGQALGVNISGGQQAWGGAGGGAQDTSIKVEAAFGAADVTIGGCRFQASKGTDAVTEPGASTNFLFLYNNFFFSNNISKGAFAAKATSIDALTNASLATASLTIGTALAGSPILASWFSFFTANFAAGIGANTFVEIDFAFPQILDLTHYQVNGNITGTLAANGALVPVAYLHDAGFVRLRMTNVTAGAVGAIAGTFWVTVTKVR